MADQPRGQSKADSTAVSFDTRKFRECLGQFPTGVCIVTAAVDGELLGMTMSSFNSLSLDPPLVLFSIGRSARSLPLWLRADGYAINVLSESQQQLSNRFAKSGTDKWAGMTFRKGAYEAPLLAGSAATIECSCHAIHEGGDHTLLVAEVERFSTYPSRLPLVFCKGAYNTLNPGNETAAIWPLDIHY